MSRFYGSFSSDCTKPTTKRGHNYVQAHVRGWNIGLQTEIRECFVCGADEVRCYLTGGSNDMRTDGDAIFRRCSADCQK